MAPQARAETGAYGLRLAGLESALLAPAPPDWPAATVVKRVGPVPETPMRVDADGGQLGIAGVTSLRASRVERTVEIVTHRAVTDDELVHPGLSAAAALFALWDGRLALHAGAFVHAGRAWGILGEKERGKSSLLASLALRGHPVVSDDLHVVAPDGGVAMGPRAVDLRPEAAERLASTGRLSAARLSTRSRLALDTIDPETPLGGWVLLEWGDDVAVEPIPAARRFAAVVDSFGWQRLAYDRMAVLAAVARPAWVLRRPRAWEREAEAIERLLAAVTEAA